MIKINIEKVVENNRAEGKKWEGMSYTAIARTLGISRNQFIEIRQQTEYNGEWYGDNERIFINLRVIDSLCRELDITPCDILEYIPDDDAADHS